MEVKDIERFPKYHEIESLHKMYLDIVACAEVVCVEKIHGTNARYGFIESQYLVGGRNLVVSTTETKGDMGIAEVGRRLDLENKLRHLVEKTGGPTILYGEVYGEGVQKVTYNLKGAGKSFILFDVKIHNYYTNWDTVVDIGKDLGVEVVPELYRGRPSQEVFDNLRCGKSIVAQQRAVDQKREGIVIKPTRVLYNEYGHRIIAKYKDPIFEERVSLRECRPIPENFQSIQQFVNEFVTSERLNHVISQLREQGVLPNSMRETGNILRGMHQDILKEGGAELKKLGVEWKQVSSLVSKTTRRLFQQYLETLTE